MTSRNNPEDGKCVSVRFENLKTQITLKTELKRRPEKMTG